MAPSLRLITSKIVPRSVIATSRLHSIQAGHHNYTTMPIDEDFYDHSRARITCSKISSISIEMTMHAEKRHLYMDIPPGSKESDVGLWVWLDTWDVEKKDMKPCAQHDTLFIQGKAHKEKGGMLKLTNPNEDEVKANIMANIIVNDILTSYHDITAKQSWDYYDMFFDSSIILKRFCPLIAMRSPTNSFLLKKDENENWLDIRIDMPGLQKMKFTTQGLRVSLEMPGLKRHDIKTFFYYDTFFIEGKRKMNHYIACIHFPKGIHKRHNMIKKQMKDGVFYAVIACEKKEEIKMN